MEPTKTAVKRLASDIKNIIKDPLDSHGIYYKHDDEDLLKGYAMIIGPEDTPYNYGYYLFEFNFPHDYPYKPPVLNFCTNGDKIRMNPNLYRSGKVCISILHPPGDDKYNYESAEERWRPVHTINSILLSIISLLSSPNDESPANIDAAKILRDDPVKFQSMVNEFNKKNEKGIH